MKRYPGTARCLFEISQHRPPTAPLDLLTPPLNASSPVEGSEIVVAALARLSTQVGRLCSPFSSTPNECPANYERSDHDRANNSPKIGRKGSFRSDGFHPKPGFGSVS
ncbi:hypothetical protein G6F24_016317 [Rhizopus arrhizus]|nr:hypothetical protein G6F24_016317 [Rhizopus arrhizus]